MFKCVGCGKCCSHLFISERIKVSFKTRTIMFRKKCKFLQDGECIIYNNRPKFCREWECGAGEET